MSANRFPTTQQRLLQFMMPIAVAQHVEGLPELPVEKKNKTQHHDNYRNFQPQHQRHLHQKPHHSVHQPAERMGKRR